MIDNETDLIVAHQDEMDSEPQSRSNGTVDWLRRTLPTALILVGLVGLAWWGHHTGWKFAASKPGPSATDGLATVVAEDASKAFGWCVEHGVHECLLHHPEVAQVPEVATVTPEDFARAQRALAVRARPENSPQCAWSRYRIRFETAEAAQKAGIDIAVAWKAAITEAVNASGELIFDPTRTARLASRVAGTAKHVTKKIGDPVQSGEVLALVDASEVGKAKADFLQALVQVRLKTKSLSNLKRAAKSVSERQMHEAEAAQRDAQARLLGAEQALANLGLSINAADFSSLAVEDISTRIQFLGLPDYLVSGLNTQATSNLLPIRAPFDGVLLNSNTIAGEVVDAGKVLFVVVDPRLMWLTLHIGMEDSRLISAGQAVTFRPDGTTEAFEGKITWVGTAADEKTRLVPARAEFENRDGRLRASTLGAGRIVLREEAGAIVVPSETIQSAGGCQLVFVRHKDFLKPDGPKEFIARSVRTGSKSGSNTEIIVGLMPNEIVATKGSGFLLDEMKKLLPMELHTRAINPSETKGRTP